MRTIILIILIFSFSACSSIPEREKAFHVMHLMDVAQTYQISKSPCHHEAGAAQLFIGNHPDESSILIWGIATAVVYHYAEKKLPDTALNMNFILKVGVVEENYNFGLIPSGYRC